MPRVKSYSWPTERLALYDLGLERVGEFCAANGVNPPKVQRVPKETWYFDGSCAYYRPDAEGERAFLRFADEDGMAARGYGVGINICLEDCGRPCGEAEGRNWTWPGSVTDREPFGVLCHELGHHCDWLASERKGQYFGDYGEAVRAKAREAPITSYCPNDAEWFAEMFRLFVTNHGLLAVIRPRTYKALTERWEPIGTADWRWVLGANVPDRILRTLTNKGAK